MEPRKLTCDGRLIANIELADTYGYDRDWYENVFLFKNDNGYELLVVGRCERYDVDGALAHAAARTDVTALPSARALEEGVQARWPASSSAWWRLLARAQEYDPDLYQLWVPERMKRDLELSSVHDKELAIETSYFGGHALDAPGRQNAQWREEAVAFITDKLSEQGWHVRPGPELSDDVQPGGIVSTGTEVVGSLWATRYGHKVPLVVRVDDCGEIYARLADVGDVAGERGSNASEVDELRTGGPVMVRDALTVLAHQIPAIGSRGGLEL